MNRRLIWLVLVFACTTLATNFVVAQNAPVKRALPQLDVKLESVVYPEAALKTRQQGRVLVAFTINKRGHAEDPVVMSADPAGEFDEAAIKAVKLVKFTVPRDWKDSGSSDYQFRLSVLFKLNPCVAPACVAPVAHPEADDFLIIGAQAAP